MRIDHERVFDPYNKISKEQYVDILSSYIDNQPSKKSEFKPIIFSQNEEIPALLKQKISVEFAANSELVKVIGQLFKQVNISFAISNSVVGNLSCDIKIVDQPLSKVINYLNEVCEVRFQMLSGVMNISKDVPYIEQYQFNFLNIQRKRLENTNVSFGFPEKTICYTNPKYNQRKKCEESVDSEDLAMHFKFKKNKNTESSTMLLISGSYDLWKELANNINFILSNDSHKHRDKKSLELPNYNYSLNKNAGILFVKAPYRVQKRVKHFVNNLKQISQLQVMVEAKVLYVEFKDEYYRGINWNLLKNTPVSLFANLSKHIRQTLSPNISSDTLPSVIGFDIKGKKSSEGEVGEAGFESFLNLLDCFGVIRTISNPRIQVLNNQVGMFRVVDNEVFNNLSFQRDIRTIGSAKTLIVNSEIQNVSLGFILVVQPSINAKTGDITMHIRPMFSSKTRDISDIGALYTLNSLKDSDQDLSKLPAPTIPIIRINEMETIATTRSGEIVALGGFMKIESQNQEQKIPGLGDMSATKLIFKGKHDRKKASEMVILLKATIIDPNTRLSSKDKRLLATFNGNNSQK